MNNEGAPENRRRHRPTQGGREVVFMILHAYDDMSLPIVAVL
jgi:hypothetical protein